ncbi:MAG: lipocalin-like domain-containing protein [Oculatellaceae cyanobacterium bins.114]|nr:lipocalin-like domain-containing protein [Oculatellaceae cyanobacterium bins.114]
MSASPPLSHALIGTWKLVSAIARLPNGTITPDVYGADPVGYITYTPEGRVLVLFARSDRPALSQAIESPFSSEIQSLSSEELAQAFLTFNAYAGTYTISGDTVIHQVEIASIPNRVGTNLLRTVAVSGDQITLSTPPLSSGDGSVFELTWERVRAIA